MLGKSYFPNRSTGNTVSHVGDFESLQRLMCWKNALPRIARPHSEHLLTTSACFRKGFKHTAASVTVLRSKPIELRSQSRVSPSRNSQLISEPFRWQKFMRDRSVIRGSYSFRVRSTIRFSTVSKVTFSALATSVHTRLAREALARVMDAPFTTELRLLKSRVALASCSNPA